MVIVFMLTICGDCLQKNKFKEGSTSVVDKHVGLQAKQMLALQGATDIDDLHKVTD